MSQTLGLDVGTQGTKGVVIDRAAGAVVARASHSYDLIAGLAPGAAEQDPRTWRAAVRDVIAELLADPVVDAIEAVAVSGQQHGCVLLDGADEPVRAAKLWCDTETATEAAELGVPTGFTASKVLWTRRHEPELWARTRRVLLPHDYINLLLTGVAAMESGDASGTGLFDVGARRFDAAAIARLDELSGDGSRLAERLPPLDVAWDRGAPRARGNDPGRMPGDLAAPGPAASATGRSGGSRALETTSSNDAAARRAQLALEPIGRVTAAAAAEFGLAEGTLVARGGGDNMMSAIGSGATRPGVVVVSLGTSGTAFAHSDAPVVDPDGLIAPFCGSAGGWLPLLCVMNLTGVSEEVLAGARGAAELASAHATALDHAALTAAARAVPAGCDGLLWLPYLAGERVPDLPRATGTLLGMRAGHLHPGVLYRAALEGTSLNLAWGVERLRGLGVTADEVRLVGGAASNPLWREVLAASLGAPVTVLEEPESGALGAALQALASTVRARGEAADLHALAARFVRLGATTEPDPKLVATYAALGARFREAVAALYA
ncbi:MAG: FGGY family carbohydrate kinase [Planctomycetota bacterium]|nr:FGGY family carbohydrate kinase [Planctomycetota bacterium]